MYIQGWNSSYANVNVNVKANASINHPGGKHSRLNGSNLSPTLLACRICEKIFANNLALLEHYESHQNELSQRRQDHLRRGNNFTYNHYQPRLPPSSTFQQRRSHPYLPNGYRMLQPQARERNSVVDTNAVLVSTRTPSLLPKSTVTNSSLGGSSLNPLSIPERGSVNNSKQLVTQHFMQTSPQKAGLSLRTKSVSAAQAVELQRSQEKKGFDESAERTVWYLGLLEKPISNIINLEYPNKKNEQFNLDLRLKL